MTFEQAVKKMFDDVSQGIGLTTQAAIHIKNSPELREHILNAAKEIDSYPIPDGKMAHIAATLNGFFEFGYRVHRIETEGSPQ